MKHWMICAGCGNEHALQRIRDGFINGHVTKDEYETALRDYQAYMDEVKSVQRDRAEAIWERDAQGKTHWTKSIGASHTTARK